VDVSPSDGGNIEINGSAPSSYPDINTFKSGANVTLEVVPASGYVFTEWSQDLSGTASIATVVMDCTRVIQANFLQTDTSSHVKYTLTVRTNGSGATVPPAGTVEYTEGQQVTITATPAAGWQFKSWNGNVADPSLPDIAIIIDSTKTVTANFEQITHDFNIDINGGGKVKYKPDTNIQIEGTVVTMQAIPDDGWQFDSWTGDVNDINLADTTLTIDSSKAVVANFSKETKETNWFNLYLAVLGGILMTFFTVIFIRRLRTR